MLNECLSFSFFMFQPDVFNIFRQCLKHGRKIIRTNSAFFYPMSAKFVHVCENFLKTLKCSFGFIECKFNNPPENFSLKVRKYSWETNLKKILKMFLWSRRMQFWQPCRKISAERPKIVIKLLFFQKETIFFKFFLCTCKMQFWQSCRIFFWFFPGIG